MDRIFWKLACNPGTLCGKTVLRTLLESAATIWWASWACSAWSSSTFAFAAPRKHQSTSIWNQSIFVATRMISRTSRSFGGLPLSSSSSSSASPSSECTCSSASDFRSILGSQIARNAHWFYWIPLKSASYCAKLLSVLLRCPLFHLHVSKRAACFWPALFSWKHVSAPILYPTSGLNALLWFCASVSSIDTSVGAS